MEEWVVQIGTDNLHSMIVSIISLVREWKLIQLSLDAYPKVIVQILLFSTFQGIWLTQWTVCQTTAGFKQSSNDIVLISAALFNSGKHKTAPSWVRPSSCDGSWKMGSSRLALSTRWALDDEKGFNLWPDITEAEHAQTLFTGLHVELLKTCKCISAKDLDRTVCLSSRMVP